jgi:hypothetical protein
VLAGGQPVLVHNIDGQPPVPTPGGPPPAPPPNGGGWVQNGPPRNGVPTWTGSNSNPNGSSPSGSWDPSGHWDVDNGYGTRTRYDWRGNEITPSQAHNPNRPSTPRNNPCP